MTITVTAEDIYLGERNNCGFCPVAIAVRRATGGDAWVYPSRMVVDGRPCPLPADVWARVLKYDVAGEMSPFEFTLEVTC
jgi:hypothetical protein